MKRFERSSVVLVAVGVIVVAAIAVSRSTTPAEAGAPARPNILLIMTDDQRATDTILPNVMPNVRSEILTPGRQFTNLYATTPLCCPNRSVLFSGRYAHNTGVRTNTDAPAFDHELSLQHELQGAGYTTAYVGKYLNEWPNADPIPYFDKRALVRGSYEDQWFNVDGNPVQVPYVTDFIGEQGVRYLNGFESDDTDPWMMVLATTAPHYPWTPSPEHADDDVGTWAGNPSTDEVDRSDKPPWVASRNHNLAGAQLVRTPQLQTLMSVDDMVGSVMSRLETLGELENTLVIFTSDNGFIWADHHLGGSHGTAGQKRYPYTASIKLPFIARWDGQITPGSRDTRIAGSVDLTPTLLDVAEVATPSYPLDGHSLLAPPARKELLLEYWLDPDQTQIPAWRSLRSKKMQFIEWFGPNGNTTFREYYDLKVDPWQLTNLLNDGDPNNDPRIGGLRKRSLGYSTCVGTATTIPPPTQPCP